MTRHGRRGRFAGAAAGLSGLLIGAATLGSAGCAQKEPGPAASTAAPTASTVASAISPPGGEAAPAAKVVVATPVSRAADSTPSAEPVAPLPELPAGVDPRLHMPFSEATLDSPSGDGERLSDSTSTGKSVGKLYAEVVRQWPAVRYVTPAGRFLSYKASVETELGTIEIQLRPEIAPNQVRNFVALARAGYYDGLCFHRLIREVSTTDKTVRRDIIEAGCPLGTGETGFGSIGYWMKPEFDANVPHEEGTVGASRAEEPDTAACKFYISLSRAPLMDGGYTVFGRVTRGLDVARKILTQPVKNDEQNPEADRPEKPVVIQKVTITTAEVDQLGSGG